MVFEEKILSVKENNLENQIIIYPNPIKDILNIKTENSILSTVSIIDFQGREVLTKSTNLNSINMSKFSSGVYFLKIKSDNNVSIFKKIIKL